VSPDATTRTSPSHGVPGLRGARWWSWILASMAVAACFAGMNRLLAGPSFVETITFVNPTAYGVDVAVTDEDRTGWLPLGEAEERASTEYEEVLDPGQVWIVRFADGEGGELRITRPQLERSGWHVRIPAAMEARLRPTWGPPELLAD
jgi:hypothetical protein